MRAPALVKRTVTPRLPPQGLIKTAGRVGTFDSTSGIHAPTTANNFTALGITAPSNLWLCQEASGNLTDTLGGYTLTANGTPTYNNAITGWTRTALGFTETASQRFQGTAGTLNPASTSVAWLVYFKLTGDPAAANRSMVVVAFSLSTGLNMLVGTGGKVRINCVAVNTDGSVNHNDGNVHPALIVYDRTGGTVKIYTDKELITGTYNASVVDGSKGFGGVSTGTAGPLRILYSFAATGATAEGYGKATLQALGWTVTGY